MLDEVLLLLFISSLRWAGLGWAALGLGWGRVAGWALLAAGLSAGHGLEGRGTGGPCTQLMKLRNERRCTLNPKP